MGAVWDPGADAGVGAVVCCCVWDDLLKRILAMRKQVKMGTGTN